MTIEFTKMQGLGNDFVVIDAWHQAIDMTPDRVRQLADRHYGIGCDQVLLLTKPNDDSADFGYRIFNADGGEVAQCGNGARCMGLFVAHKQLSDKKRLVLATQAGLLAVENLGKGQFSVALGVPQFAPEALPYLPDESLPEAIQLLGFVSVGNPHALIQVAQIDLPAFTKIGACLNAHPAFPEGVNVGFVQIKSTDALNLLVYERGAGLTKACGSGAAAAVAIGQKEGLLANKVLVHQQGGDLSVSRNATNGVLSVSGPAAVVFDGLFF